MPLFLDSDGKAWPMKRVRLDDRMINEGTLQKLLHENPGLLPVDEIDGSFGPLVSLGREILGIDNLFLSASGRLTLVETKLWRNPQATREVVAQILDYASRLSALDPEGLEEACRSARTRVLEEGQSLYELAAENIAEMEASVSEVDFHDTLARTLRNARFLLLIVGDGIREGLEDILGLVHDSPQRRFTFGLVELRIHECEHPRGLVVMPRLVTRTREIIRAVVKVEHPSDVRVEVTFPKAEETRDLSVEEFVEQAADAVAKGRLQRIVDFGRGIGYVTVVCNANNWIGCRVPVNGSQEGIRIFRSGKYGGMWFTDILGQLRRLGRDTKPAEEHVRNFEEIFSHLPAKTSKTRSGGAPGTLPRHVKAANLAEAWPRVQVMFQSLAKALLDVGPGEAIVVPMEDGEEEDAEV